MGDLHRDPAHTVQIDLHPGVGVSRQNISEKPGLRLGHKALRYSCGDAERAIQHRGSGGVMDAIASSGLGQEIDGIVIGGIGGDVQVVFADILNVGSQRGNDIRIVRAQAGVLADSERGAAGFLGQTGIDAVCVGLIDSLGIGRV